MNAKFLKSIRVDYQLANGVVESVLTSRGDGLFIRFSVQASTIGQQNKATVEIFNKSLKNYYEVYHDPYNTSTLRSLDIYAGYNDTEVHIFSGFLSSADTQKQSGSTEPTIIMNAWDGGYAFNQSYTAEGYPTNSSLLSVATSLISKLKLKGGFYVSPATASLIMNTPLITNGNTINQLISLAKQYNCQFYIDKNKGYFIGVNETVDNEALLITEATGLLNSPIRKETIIVAQTILEPNVRLGGLCEINSVKFPIFNGGYKCVAFAHAGDSGSGQNTTQISLFTGTTIYTRG